MAGGHAIDLSHETGSGLNLSQCASGDALTRVTHAGCNSADAA